MSGIGPISTYDSWKLCSPHENDDDWDDEDDDWDDEDDKWGDDE